MEEIREWKDRDGNVIAIDDEVTTSYHSKCVDQVFVVCGVNPYTCSESGALILTHLKGDPERKLGGMTGLGLDTNWFKKC